MSTLKKPEVSKAAVAAGVNSLTGLLRRREKLGANLDALSDAIGAVYKDLAEVQRAIGQELFHGGGTGGAAPAWLADSTTAYRLRNRLGAACAPHSSGGGNESPFGPVQCRMPLREVFAKDNASLQGKGGGQ